MNSDLYTFSACIISLPQIFLLDFFHSVVRRRRRRVDSGGSRHRPLPVHASRPRGRPPRRPPLPCLADRLGSAKISKWRSTHSISVHSKLRLISKIIFLAHIFQVSFSFFAHPKLRNRAQVFTFSGSLLLHIFLLHLTISHNHIPYLTMH